LFSCLETLVKHHIQQRQNEQRKHLQLISEKLKNINYILKCSNDEIRKKNDKRIEHEHLLYNIRRQRLNEVYKYIFPIERVSSIEELSRM
jgi:hypothetical protein